MKNTELEVNQNKLLEVSNLSKIFKTNSRDNYFNKIDNIAVNNISFDIRSGETIGVVGESGCGKSTLAKLIVNLLTPTDGSILYKGTDIKTIVGNDLKKLRKNIQIIFQDPYSTLNPRLKIGKAISEPLSFHKIVERSQIKKHCINLLEQVGLNAKHFDLYPNSFSGGQRQRISIARSLSVKPELLIADEPVSSLDVSIQAQIINLLINYQSERNIAILFISHDLAIVKNISDKILVMYLGKIIEKGRTREIFSNPKHPYTQALLSSIPQSNPHKRSRKKIILKGDVPKLFNNVGCCFISRCSSAVNECKNVTPPYNDITGSHKVACHLYN